MGKKKDKARRKQAEREAARHGRHGEMRFDIPPQVAGIAAAALKQVDTPAFKQMIAGALGAAAQAFDRRRADAARPAPPQPTPQPTAEPELRPAPGHPFAFAMPDMTLSPEAARAIDQATTQATRAVESAAAIAAQAIGTAAAALERWTAKQAGAPGHAPDGPAPRPEAQPEG